MATTPGAAVLHLLADRLSIMDSSSCDSNSCTMASPSSAATSFELPSKNTLNEAGSCQEAESSHQAGQFQEAEPPYQAEIFQPRPQSSPTLPLSFTSLPSDIHHLILTDYLPYDSIVALRSTSHYFQSLISPATLKRLRQNVVSNLLAEERALLKKWLPQPYGRYSGRPTTHITCYSCLQSLPVTDFFAYQVSLSRGLGRKRAAERWCKPCGLKYGKIRHGRWMDEVSYSIDDQFRYEEVMGMELKVDNHCATCPRKHRYDGQHVWWGCVDCFEKEEQRLQKEDSEKRRDLRRHCSKAKRRVKAFVEPENLRELGQEVGWWMKTRLGWSGLVRRSWRIYWWAKDESLVSRMCRTCRRVGRVLDPRQMQEPGQKLGRKAKMAVGVVIGLGKKNEKSGTADGIEDTPPVAAEDCIICSGGCTDLTPKESDNTPVPTTPKRAASHPENHVCLSSPRREVRCWRCWRAKRSRRRRRYDNGMADGFPLPKERWCDGCQAEHGKFVAMRRERKMAREEEGKGKNRQKERERERAMQEDEMDVGLIGLFEET